MAARDLVAEGKSLVEAGAVVVEILTVVSAVHSPTKIELDRWVNYVGLPVTSVIDSSTSALRSFNELGGDQRGFIVDLRTMRIVAMSGGGGSTSSVAVLAIKLHELLGK